MVKDALSFLAGVTRVPREQQHECGVNIMGVVVHVTWMHLYQLVRRQSPLLPVQVHRL